MAISTYAGGLLNPFRSFPNLVFTCYQQLLTRGSLVPFIVLPCGALSKPELGLSGTRHTWAMTAASVARLVNFF